MTIVDTAPHDSVRPPAAARPAYRGLVGAELGKLRTQPSLAVLTGVSVAIAPLAAAVFCVTLPVTQGRNLREVSTPDVLSATMLGIDATTVAVVVLGALAVGSEYTTGLIQQSVTVTPRRARLLSAKIAALAAVLLVVAVLCVLLAGAVAGFAVASVGRPFSGVLEGGGTRLALGSILVPVFYGTVAALAAFLLRSGALGIFAALAVLVLSSVLGWFGAGVDGLLTPLTPLAALHSIAGIASGAQDIGIVRGCLSLVAWIGVTSVAATWRFSRKDV